MRERIRGAFIQHFGTEPAEMVRAPGRVNLIGEHTDYNDGFVLPMAIDRAVYLAATPRSDRQVRLLSVDFGQTSASSLDDIRPDATAPWSDYVRGVLWVLQRAGHTVGGMDIALTGDVPIGAGLSSSAAVEVATATACCVLFGLALTPTDVARLCQRAEMEFVGIHCGIMDQLISAAGVARHAVLIDCRNLSLRPVPLPGDAAVVVCDTSKRRGLVDSAYNERRAQCEQGARLLGVSALREVTVTRFEREANRLPPLVRRRCQHIVHENARTVAAADALEQGDLAAVGRLMDASHASLRDLFEVSCPELDAMVAIARAQPGCLGARMTGAGFGGCAVALVARTAVAAFTEAIPRAYQRQTGLEPALYVCAAAAGAGKCVGSSQVESPQ